MNIQTIQRRLTDALVHQPFDCQDVYLYLAGDENLVAADEASAGFLEAYERPIRAISSGDSPVCPIWFIGIRASAGGPAEGLCCSGCRVSSLTVIVSKRLQVAAANRRPSSPIDDYFIDALRIRVAEIVGVDLSKGSSKQATGGLRTEEGLYAELRALEVFEPDWRRVYGEEEWLAVKGGTVVAHGAVRKGVERQIRDQAIEPPVLYVPPKKEEQVCEMFSIGL